MNVNGLSFSGLKTAAAAGAPAMGIETGQAASAFAALINGVLIEQGEPAESLPAASHAAQETLKAANQLLEADTEQELMAVLGKLPAAPEEERQETAPKEAENIMSLAEALELTGAAEAFSVKLSERFSAEMPPDASLLDFASAADHPETVPFIAQALKSADPATREEGLGVLKLMKTAEVMLSEEQPAARLEYALHQLKDQLGKLKTVLQEQAEIANRPSGSLTADRAVNSAPFFAQLYHSKQEAERRQPEQTAFKELDNVFSQRTEAAVPAGSIVKLNKQIFTVQSEPATSVPLPAAEPAGGVQNRTLPAQVQLMTPPEEPDTAERPFKTFEQLFSRMQFGQANGTTRLMVRLYPEHLGSVRIELVQKEGIVTARLLASNAQGKELLDSSLNQLKQAFVQQNIAFDRIEVAQTLQTPDRQGKQQSSGQPEQEHKREQEEQADFKEVLLEVEA